MFFNCYEKRQWHGVKSLGACVCVAICIQDVCVGPHACIFMCQNTCIICAYLLLCTLSDSYGVIASAITAAAERTVCPCAGGRGCPLPPLKRKLLFALRRNKSFIWFVVFLTKSSWSRNKALLSIPSAPILSPLSATTHLTLSCK